MGNETVKIAKIFYVEKYVLLYYNNYIFEMIRSDHTGKIITMILHRALNSIFFKRVLNIVL